MDKLKVFTAFSGYDSQCMALDRLGIEYELVGWSEIDRYAIIAHDSVYPKWKDRNFGDISKIDWNDVPDFDLFTYSFPCTDISSAGQQKGLEEGSGTRSSLLWECRKAIESKKPKYLLMENVKALTSRKFLPYLHKWMSWLDNLGYSNYAKVLNAKDYGVPQNRERLFVVSILGGGTYSFPKPFGLELRLKDILEENVDESYYISDKTVKRMIKNNNTSDFCVDTNGTAKTVCSSCYKMTTFDNYVFEPYVKQYPRGFNDGFEYKDGISPTITTSSWEHNNLLIEPRFVEYTRDYNGKVTKRHLQNVCNTIHCGTGTGGNTDCFVAVPVNGDYISVLYKDHILNEGDGLYLHSSYDFDSGSLQGTSRTLKAEKYDAGVVCNYRIRKLTNRECFRLMGVSEENIDKIQNAGISKTQQYKMAGNSIVVDVLYHIFRKLFIDKDIEDLQLKLF